MIEPPDIRFAVTNPALPESMARRVPHMLEKGVAYKPILRKDFASNPQRKDSL